MLKYSPPIRDFTFVLHELLRVDTVHPQLAGLEDSTVELTRQILDEAGKFCAEVIAPLNQSGDAEGCHIADGVVTTPTGFKAAYAQFRDAGWAGLVGDPAQGGMGQPYTVGCAVVEMMAAANLAWSMYPGLSHGAATCLHKNGNDEQRRIYETKLLTGQWTGTMCLTEPHCGSDLGMLKTRAEPEADGSYRLHGTKIFISAGEHDLAENIIHLVLARLPGAPAGTKGISMFLVPKYLPDAAGEAGARNAIRAGSIEHKMGIKASSTCVMNLDGAIGWLVGPEHKGLNAMFVMMNTARLEVGIQGQGLIEISRQNALAYARERLQMRSLSGPKAPERPADPIIVHPDVRRMLLTQKALAEGGRALCMWTAHLVDLADRSASVEQRRAAETLLSFLTPIVKGFMTEAALEATSHGIQVLGGHGYIREWGLEQLLRDARITTIYEGTTQIQALDLLARKIMQSQGAGLELLIAEIKRELAALPPGASPHAAAVEARLDRFARLTQVVGGRAMANADEIGAAAVDYLMYAGYLLLGYWWVRMEAIAATRSGEPFYASKLATARFYFARMWPRLEVHAAGIEAGAANLIDIDEALFDVA